MSRLTSIVVALVLVVVLTAAGCSDDDESTQVDQSTSSSTTSTSAATSTAPSGPVELAITEVATGLDTVWALTWDSKGQLWFTERQGRVTRLGQRPVEVPGVVEQGEGGLMGLAFDDRDQAYVMFTADEDNRVAPMAADGTLGQAILTGVRKSGNHNGGRILFDPRDKSLLVSTGDATDTSLPPKDSSLNGKVLKIDLASGSRKVFSKGRRNIQGLCFDRSTPPKLYATEHGPERGDEINVVTEGSDGGWPDTAGNGIKNYTPTIAPAGCTFYDANLIPQWKGSMLFVTLKERDLRRLTFTADGRVADEEILYDNEYGRLRDVTVGPDGAVYLATSNKDGRGNPTRNDDRIVKIAPVAENAAGAGARTAAAGASAAASPTEPVAAGDPAGLAVQIEGAERAIADPSVSSASLSKAAHTQQVAYRKLVLVPEWKDQVAARLPEDLRPSLEANVTAGAKLRSMVKPKETLPAWRIVAPAPADELLGYYRRAEAEFGVPWHFLAAIHLVETRMGRIRGTSSAGAKGPMQFLPATWRQYGNGGDIESNRDSIAAAARYLARNGAPSDMRNALWNYNHDVRYVDAVTLYAEQMAADARAHGAYHQWQVYYITTRGDVWLPEGWTG